MGMRRGTAAAATTVMVALVLGAPVGSGSQLPVSPSWSWDRLTTFTYGSNSTCDVGDAGQTPHCNMSGADSRAEVQWKLKYDLVMIDNSGGTYGWGVGANCTRNSSFTACNHEKSRVASEIRAADPHKPVTVYRETLCRDGTALPSPDALWLNPLTKKRVKMSEIWLADSAGVLQPGVCDLRTTDAQDYVLTHNYFGEDLEFLHDDNITGMFVDSGIVMGLVSSSKLAGDAAHPPPITVGTRRELFNGTCTLFKRAADMLGSVGKFLTVSLKAHFSSITETGGGTSGGIICDPSEPDSLIFNFTARRKNCYDQQWCDCWPYGEDVLAEIMGETWSRSGSFVPFREYNIPSRDFGKGNAKTMDAATLKLAQARGCAAAVVDHALEARRGSTIACNNDGAPGLVNGSAGFGLGPYGNITFLGQHRISLAAFMLGMEEGSYFGSGMHWSDAGWHYWFPEYNKPLGKPKGQYTRDGFVFKRSFEHVDVTADCETLATTFDWHGGGSGPAVAREAAASVDL